MRRFLPALRSTTTTTKALALPAVVASPIRAETLEKKVVLASYYNAVFRAGYETRARDWSIERAIELGYERIVWVFKSVNAITGNWSRLPIVVRDGKDVVEDHPLAQLLNGITNQLGKPSANPLESGPVLRKRLGAQALLSKPGVFIEVTKSYGGTLRRLDLLPPGRTKIIPPERGDELVDHLEVTNIRGQRRRVEWENVLWIRDPHPLDPYSGITPLEPAGLSAELDHMARLYNVNFLARDGRPGGIVAVEASADEDGDMDPAEMDRIEAKFGKGPQEAGALTVLSGKVTYVDPSSRPRDMAYTQLADHAKAEILGAFGVPLSVIGDASGRTFSNAQQELDNFWLVEPMPNFLKTMLDGLQPLLAGEGLEIGVDDSKVESMVRAKEAALAAAREEVKSGLRSIYSYAQLAGRTDEIEDTPQTRALWIPPGMNPLPSRESDAAAVNGAQAAPGQPQPGAAPGGPPDPGQPGELPADGAPDAGPPAVSSAHQALAALPAATSATSALAALSAKSARRARSQRVRVVRLDPADEESARTHAVPKTARNGHEDAIAAALEALTERLVERTAARLIEPKRRKGTRHFTPEHAVDSRVGTKALDSAKVVDPDRWGHDAVEAAQAATDAAAADAAARAETALADDGEHHVARDVATAVVVAGALDMLRRSAQMQGERLAAALNLADQAGESIAQLVLRVRTWAGRLRRWARGISAQITTAIVEGCGQAVALAMVHAGEIDPGRITQTWVTRHDERVRHTHQAADGQTVALTAPFVVGRALLRYPGDPLGPAEETANCRCVLRIKVRAARPAPLVLAR